MCGGSRPGRERPRARACGARPRAGVGRAVREKGWRKCGREGRETGRDVGRRREWVGLSCGKREGAGLVWAGPQGLDGFLVLGFLFITPFLFLFFFSKLAQTNNYLNSKTI